ncbi:ovarian cancer G-protein coupled receptor 1-like [Onychostoma macrolepis]|uniref:ovarian cancer G-protein coupled receptor 1-like n=1 Tax=Onychostoma macrolepis TaxID=369639 RepID=UPI00272B2F2B|nr:ovarian cancer G-protein coupled receptor 1-like [Onychostoma macrolepis]XP_058628891.1 ovarian cancer G-protein coupled receptor 1-like [Onychostoma macrolepis]XP_058628892.1 ovarian cancer G-protein coupled receptor 1-like [Onychostoma macrolepis]XP_058628893.1 ovarian cancer G-protein coupled receptor 1-like [Onychostoma macrolepis]XP_058628894.1 ovarian cancer G-protein coupled receptor 1-like [Onychostoma macrolepis]
MAQHNISINDSTASDHDLLQHGTWKSDYAELVFIRVLSVVEIPVMILTLIGLCFIIKSRHAVSVFVSNLILSDLIQVICLLIAASTTSSTRNLTVEYYYSLMVGLYFMACVAFERYLLVSHPIWYRSHQSLKLSCFISVIVWFVLLIFVIICPHCFNFNHLSMCIACLIPYPIIILCFAGTCRGLSRSISLTALQRKLILGSLFLVLLTYTFLILPYVIMVFMPYVGIKPHHYTQLPMYVNPLADCFLYMFIRSDVRNMMKSVCCCRRHQSLNDNQDERSVVNPQNSCCTVVCCISAQKPASHALNTCSSV